ncbi:MAG: cupin-like domain-containing protein [Deltaproteobacteria bacterium]|nr:cupin-like domain-containing protein [Deltaproteobacteria bacterium]
MPSSFPGPEEIDRVVLTFQRSPSASRRLRIYVDGERRDDISQRVLDARFDESRPMFEQLLEVAGSQRAAFMINDLQDHSAATRTAVGELLSTMYPVRGMPHGGLGASSSSPATTRRRCSAFIAASNTRSCATSALATSASAVVAGALPDRDRQPRRRAGQLGVAPEHAIDLTLKPGDMLYLPAQWFHIGIQDEYPSASRSAPYDWARIAGRRPLRRASSSGPRRRRACCTCRLEHRQPVPRRRGGSCSTSPSARRWWRRPTIRGSSASATVASRRRMSRWRRRCQSAARITCAWCRRAASAGRSRRAAAWPSTCAIAR